jgi:hypothetical protein
MLSKSQACVTCQHGPAPNSRLYPTKHRVAVAPSIGPVGRRCPPACHLVRCLCHERHQLPLLGIKAPHGAEAREGAGCRDEGRVGVEAVGRACGGVFLL